MLRNTKTPTDAEQRKSPSLLVSPPVFFKTVNDMDDIWVKADELKDILKNRAAFKSSPLTTSPAAASPSLTDISAR